MKDRTITIRIESDLIEAARNKGIFRKHGDISGFFNMALKKEVNSDEMKALEHINKEYVEKTLLPRFLKQIQDAKKSRSSNLLDWNGLLRWKVKKLAEYGYQITPEKLKELAEK